MRTLAEWVKEGPLTCGQAIGWLVRLSRGLLVLHELDVPYGRVSAACVSTSALEPRARAMLLDADGVRQDFHFYSLDRIERTGASKDDDVWALGVLLYHLVTGGYPFSGDSRRKVGERIKWMPASPIEVYEVDHPGVQRLLDRLFKPDEGMRLASLPLLIDALVSLDPATDALPPLELEVEVGAPSEDAAPKATAPKATAQKAIAKPAPSKAAAPKAIAKPAPSKAAAPNAIAKPAPSKAPAPNAKEPAPSKDAAPKAIAKPAPSKAAAPNAKEPAPNPSTSPPATASASEAPRPSERVARSAKAERGSGWLWIVVGAVFGIGAVVYVQLLMDPAPAALPSAVSDPPSVATPPEPPPSANPSAQASSTPSATPPRDAGACVREMFPADAFADTKPALEAVCTGADPVSLAEQLRGNVVEGKPQPGVITGAMRLWSEMGWFRMAFVAAARVRCCENALPFETELGGPPCGLDSSLMALGAAAAHGDDEQFRLALAHYTTSVKCMSSAPTSAIYGLNAPAEDGQLSAFRVAATRFRFQTPQAASP